ncbi:MAG: hypothetical protein VX768_02345 [Planctomycetota bacterium]|nr:hypothetical protein [Planctomycetota bacterium]
MKSEAEALSLADGQGLARRVTLANSNEMGFRVLLGREAFRGLFLVDASRSFAGGRLRRKNKRRSDNS